MCRPHNPCIASSAVVKIASIVGFLTREILRLLLCIVPRMTSKLCGKPGLYEDCKLFVLREKNRRPQAVQNHMNSAGKQVQWVFGAHGLNEYVNLIANRCSYSCSGFTAARLANRCPAV